VLYGGNQTVHFSADEKAFKNLDYAWWLYVNASYV
jgi:hypothetical protein